MKNLKYLVLFLVLVLILSGCTKSKKVEKSNITPLLFEVTKDDNKNKIYLFGSIHAGEESMYPLPEYVLEAYRKSKKTAFEFDLINYEQDMTNQTNLLSNFVINDGKSIKDYIETDTYNRGVEILENVGLYNPFIDSYKPIMWVSLLENAVISESSLAPGYGIDRYFLELAKNDKKEIIELESAELQYNILLSFSDEVQTYLLRQSIIEYESEINSLEQLYELYKKGNKEELEKTLFVDEENIEQYKLEYNQKLITNRNKNMTEALEEEFYDGKNIFCVVGLMHIIGKNGIVDLLEQKGYTVKILK